MTETLADWLPVDAAARAIGCSKRTIERLAQQQKIGKALRPQAGSPAVAVYDPQDVAELAAERKRRPAAVVLGAIRDPGSGNGNGHGKSLTETPGSFPETLGLTSAGDDPIRQLFAAALRAVLSPPSPPVAATVAETLFLTVKEAAAVSGLTQAYVRRLILAKRLPAERDRGWKIRRKDLEAL